MFIKKVDKSIEIRTTIGGNAKIKISNLGGNMKEEEMKEDAEKLMGVLEMLPLGTLLEVKKMLNNKTHIG